MPALSDPKLEAFCQAMLRNMAKGLSRSKAAERAGDEVGYRGSSAASNARRRGQRADVKARLIELAAPAQAQVEADLALDVVEAKISLAKIIRAGVKSLASAKPEAVVAAVRQLSAMESWDGPKRHEHTGADGAPLFDVSKLNDGQLAALEDILVAVAAVAADDQGGTELSPPEGKPH